MSPLPILVADIGGTNSRLALAREAEVLPDTVVRLENAGFAGPEALIGDYLARLGGPQLGGVCAAVAGAVTEGAAFMTNLDWKISEAGLSKACGGVPALLLNDLQAQGHALDALPAGGLREVVAGEAGLGPRMVIGVGTGFNAAVVHDGPGVRLVTASEAGHATLPALDGQVAKLAADLVARGLPPEIEETLSGRGLAQIDRFLGHGGRTARAVIDCAPDDPGAAAALALFVRLLGGVAGDLALVHLPWGGVYLAGGMARAVAHRLGPDEFAAAFCAKGRLSHLLKRIPVWLIEDDFAALTGCAAHMQRDGAG